MPSPLEIKVYVVLDGSGRIVGVKLNKASASALALKYKNAYLLPMVADKR